MKLLGNKPLTNAEKAKRYRINNPEKYQAQYRALNERRKLSGEGKAYARSLSGLYTAFKRQANYRGIPYSMSFEEFHLVRGNPCYYCGGRLPEAGVGLDRIDNNQGYTTSNVLPCCEVCNSTRNRHYSVEETKVMIEALLKFRKGIINAV